MRSVLTYLKRKVFLLLQTLLRSFPKEVGFSGAGAAGAIGNSIGESGLKLHNPNTGGGVNGLFQWSGWGNTVNGSRLFDICFFTYQCFYFFVSSVQLKLH